MKFYVINEEDEDKWNKYSIKMLAFSETKGWAEGLRDKSPLDDMKKKAKNYLIMPFTGKEFIRF